MSVNPMQLLNSPPSFESTALGRADSGSGNAFSTTGDFNVDTGLSLTTLALIGLGALVVLKFMKK